MACRHVNAQSIQLCATLLIVVAEQQPCRLGSLPHHQVSIASYQAYPASIQQRVSCATDIECQSRDRVRCAATLRWDLILSPCGENISSLSIGMRTLYSTPWVTR